MELLALYGRRWEHEVFYKELKVDTRSMPYLRSHKPLTAMQEMAAMIIAYAVLVDCRVAAAKEADVEVLRISFLKTHDIVQGLWRFLEVSSDLLGPEGVKVVVSRTMEKLGRLVTKERRHRTCPRALRKPVSSWPRLRRNTYNVGTIDYTIERIG